MFVIRTLGFGCGAIILTIHLFSGIHWILACQGGGGASVESNCIIPDKEGWREADGVGLRMFVLRTLESRGNGQGS